MTPEEKESIILEAVERSLLAIPEVVGNLMAQNATYNKINSKFYKDYPEFKDKKEIVVSVVEMIDGQNPGLDYEDVLKKALPEIRKRVAITKGVNVTSITDTPDRNFGNGEV